MDFSTINIVVPSLVSRVSVLLLTCRLFLRLTVFPGMVLVYFAIALLFLDQIKPIEQLVPVN